MDDDADSAGAPLTRADLAELREALRQDIEEVLRGGAETVPGLDQRIGRLEEAYARIENHFSYARAMQDGEMRMRARTPLRPPEASLFGLAGEAERRWRVRRD